MASWSRTAPETLVSAREEQLRAPGSLAVANDFRAEQTRTAAGRILSSRILQFCRPWMFCPSSLNRSLRRKKWTLSERMKGCSSSNRCPSDYIAREEQLRAPGSLTVAAPSTTGYGVWLFSDLLASFSLSSSSSPPLSILLLLYMTRWPCASSAGIYSHSEIPR